MTSAVCWKMTGCTRKLKTYVVTNACLFHCRRCCRCLLNVGGANRTHRLDARLHLGSLLHYYLQCRATDTALLSRYDVGDYPGFCARHMRVTKEAASGPKDLVLSLGKEGRSMTNWTDEAVSCTWYRSATLLAPRQCTASCSSVSSLELQ